MLLWSFSSGLPGEGLFSLDLILKKKAPVEGAFVCIGEVATVIASVAEKEQAEKIKKICFMSTPLKAVVLKSDLIRQELILRSGYDAPLPRRILGKSVLVEPVLREVTIGELDRKLQECYSKNPRYESQKYRFFILNEGHILGDAQSSLDRVVLKLPRAMTYELHCRWGNLSAGLKTAQLSALSADRPQQKKTYDHRGLRKSDPTQFSYELSYLIGIRHESFVATRSIEKGERLGRHDFRAIVDYVLEDGRKTKLAQPMGMQARRDIQSGESLKPADLKRVIDIERGSVVELEYRFGAVRVRLAARAMQPAAIGEVVSFYLLKSNRKVKARVLSPTSAVLEERN